nr:MAG TPA: hypothetical protein [Caudoviricetes sp.]
MATKATAVIVVQSCSAKFPLQIKNAKPPSAN